MVKSPYFLLFFDEHLTTLVDFVKSRAFYLGDIQVKGTP
jgi:hypothetical protein